MRPEDFSTHPLDEKEHQWFRWFRWRLTAEDESKRLSAEQRETQRKVWTFYLAIVTPITTTLISTGVALYMWMHSGAKP